MPIYEYRCGACGFQQEYLQKMSATPMTDCPECGKPTLSKMVTAAGFQLKGSGWYATDFKHGAKPMSQPASTPAAKSDDKPAAAGDAPAAKTETKPAAETSAKKTDTAASAANSGAGTSPAST